MFQKVPVADPRHDAIGGYVETGWLIGSNRGEPLSLFSSFIKEVTKFAKYVALFSVFGKIDLHRRRGFAIKDPCRKTVPE